MVRQGDIIKLNLSPQKGHEQAGFRPAVVVSNDLSRKVTNLSLICPVTNTVSTHPLHVRLDDRTKTTGEIMCEQIRSIDLEARPYRVVERIPDDLLWDVSDLVRGLVETGL